MLLLSHVDDRILNINEGRGSILGFRRGRKSD